MAGLKPGAAVAAVAEGGTVTELFALTRSHFCGGRGDFGEKVVILREIVYCYEHYSIRNRVVVR